MDKKEVIRILKTEKQYVCSAPGTYMLAQGPMLGFTRTNKYFREYYHYEIVIYKKKFICQCESWNQAYKNNKQLYDDPKTAKKKVIGWARLREEFLEMCSKLPNPAEISELDNRKLESSFFAYLERLNEVMAAPLVTDGIGVYTETDLWEDFLREENRKDARKIFLELTHSPTLSFAGQEKLGFLNLLLLYKKNRRNSSQFETKLAEHQRRFFWINNDYTQVRVLDRKYFLDKIKKDKRKEEDIKKEIDRMDSRKIVNNQNRLLEEVRISDGMKDKIELTQLLSTWQDERKELDLIGKHYQNEFLKQIAKKMRLSIDEIYFVHLKEIREFFRTGRIPSKKMIKSRMDLCVHVADIPLTEDVLFEGKDAEDIIEAFESIADEKELKGTIASYGKEKIIKGEVNVILNPAKSDFRKGQILVTTMTRPEFVPLMHHAKAIITDEGGVTTHAGIVSRELGIACIVGVRSATKLLKTGDKIEINMKTGEIRKI